jgi:exodeoxyribonuclease V alpha subunit
MPIEPVTVRAVIKRVLYRKPEGGWSILATDQFTAKGTIAWEPHEGDIVRLEGNWKLSTFNGKQEFVFKTAMLDVPTDSRALLHYAASLTTGIGPSKEQAIWDAYGEKWREQDLSGMTGFSNVTREIWADTLKKLADQKEMTAAITFVMSKGGTLNMATKAWEKWMASAISTITANPYSIADLPYCGFNAADALRKNFGITEMDPRRVDAAILYVLNKCADEQGTLVTRKDLKDALVVIIPGVMIHGDLFEAALVRLEAANRTMTLPGGVALFTDYAQEKTIWEAFATT